MVSLFCSLPQTKGDFRVHVFKNTLLLSHDSGPFKVYTNTTCNVTEQDVFDADFTLNDVVNLYRVQKVHFSIKVTQTKAALLLKPTLPNY